MQKYFLIIIINIYLINTYQFIIIITYILVITNIFKVFLNIKEEKFSCYFAVTRFILFHLPVSLKHKMQHKTKRNINVLLKVKSYRNLSNCEFYYFYNNHIFRYLRS